MEKQNGRLPPSVGSSRLALRPCFELLCTNILSDTVSKGPSIETTVETATCNVPG